MRILRAEGRRATGEAGFTFIELLIVVGIVSALAYIALPKIFGSREKAIVSACDANYHRMDGDLTTKLSEHEAAGDSSAAEKAIDEVIELTRTEGVPNPRNKGMPGFVDAGDGPVIPGANTACQVFFYDGTGPDESDPPTVVVTQFEHRARSFRIALN